MSTLTLDQLYLITGADVAFGLFEQIDEALRKTKDAAKIKLADDLKKFCVDANEQENDLTCNNNRLPPSSPEEAARRKNFVSVTAERLIILHEAKAALPDDKEIQKGLGDLIAALPSAFGPAPAGNKSAPQGPK